MIAIFRRELKLYFISLPTYIILAVTLLCFGLLSDNLNLFMGYASLSFPLGYMIVVAVITIPLLLIFQYLKERRCDSEKHLLSLPVSSVSIVLGKFLSSMVVLFIPFLVMLFLPLLFSFWGAKDAIPSSEMSVLGYILLCTFLLSLSQLILTCVKRKLLAIIFAVALPLLFYAIHLLLSLFYFEGIFDFILSLIDPIRHFYAFTYGFLDLPSLVYFIVSIISFLFFTILTLNSKRGVFNTKGGKRNATVIIASILAVFLILNIGVMLLPEKIARTDISGMNTFRISGRTEELVKNLKDPVTLYYLCEGGKKNAESDLLSFLKKYDEESDLFSVKIIDTEKEPNFSKTYTGASVADQSMIFESATRHLIVKKSDLYYYENQELGKRFSEEYYHYLQSIYLAYLETGDTSKFPVSDLSLAHQLFTSSATSVFFNGESVITNAIHYVTSPDVPIIYILMSNTFSIREECINYFLPYVEESGFFVKHITSLKSIPKDCDLLLLFPIEKDLQKEEADALRSYLDVGGKMVTFTDGKENLTNFYSVLSDYGLYTEEKDNLLFEGDKEKLIVEEYNIFNAKVNATPATGGKFEGSFVAITPHSIVLKDKENVTLTPWITTSEKGYLVTEDFEENQDVVYNTYVLGALAEKGNTRIAWISSPLSISYTMGQNLSSGGNYSLLVSAFKWLTDSSYNTISFTATEISTPLVYLSDSEIAVWRWIFILPLPILAATIGGIRTYVRKKK